MHSNLFIVNVEAAIYKEDEWLIIKRSEMEEHAPGELALVGGKVELVQNEKRVLENTIVREVMEEVGVFLFDQYHYVESTSFTTDSGAHVINIVYLCKYKSGIPKSISESEVSEVNWMTTKEIIENTSAPLWLRESILSAQKVKDKLEM